MRNHPLRPTLVLVLASVLTGLLFYLGIAYANTPFWGRFLLPIVVVFLWGRRRDIYVVTALASVLVFAIYWLNGPTTFGELLVNYLLPVATLWAAAWLLARRRQLHDELGDQRRQLLDQQQKLAAEVSARTAELGASERRYRLLAENAGDLIWTVDMDGNFTYVSAAAQRVRGVTREEELTSSWFDRMPPETAAGAAAAIQADLAALRAGRPIDETPHPAPAYRKDGTLMWSETVMSPLYGEDGKPLGLCGTTRDITARHRVEEALRQSQEQLAKIFSSNPGGIAILRQSDSCLLEANDAFLTILSYTGEEIIGRSAVELGIMTPEARVPIMAAVLDHGYVRGMDMQIVGAQGQVVDVYFSIEQVDFAGEPCFLLLLVDVTERKRLEEALRDSEERFRLIVQNSPDVLALYDEQGCLSYLSPAVMSTHDVTVEHALAIDPLFVRALRTPLSTGPQAAELDQVRSLPYFPERRRVDEAVTYCLEHPGEQCRLEITNVLPSGEVKYFDIAYRAHQRAGGARQVVSITRDITARKHLEQQLQGLNDDLEHRIAARTADLQSALADVQRANRLKDEFMAMISHELRTPLSNVLAMAQVLEEQIAGPLNGRQSLYVDNIVTSGERLLYVINGILGYTHLISGKFVPQPALCELASLLGICATSQEYKAVAKNQAITVHVEPADLTIASDPIAIAEVLKRLIDNAIRFTPSGGQIGLEAQYGRFSGTSDLVVGSDLMAVVDIVVWDTGIGLDLGQLDDILKPFTQVDARLARGYEGLGLGLAYVDQMVHLLGGTLAVTSQPGQGSCFTITLPVTLPAA
jgi:PAS domain S-box-containing protein